MLYEVITWESLEDIKNWKQQTEHIKAQLQGRADWYSWYHAT